MTLGVRQVNVWNTGDISINQEVKMKRVNWFIVSVLGVAGSIASIYGLFHTNEEGRKTTFGDNSPVVSTQGDVSITINEKKKNNTN